MSELTRKEEDWKRIRSLIEHENTLSNSRQNWHALIQAFLFAAWANFVVKILEPTQWPKQVPALLLAGIILMIINFVGASAAVVAITSMNGASRAQHNALYWWFSTYREESVRNTRDATQGSLNSLPPIDGGTELYPYKQLSPNLIPHLILWAWLSISVLLVVSIAGLAISWAGSSAVALIDVSLKNAPTSGFLFHLFHGLLPLMVAIALLSIIGLAVMFPYLINYMIRKIEVLIKKSKACFALYIRYYWNPRLYDLDHVP
jgi:hypothetical protein